MARKFQCGFETGCQALGITEFYNAQALTGFTFDTGTVRTGTRSGKFTASSYQYSPLGLNVTEAYVRIYLNISANPAHDATILSLATAAATDIGHIKLRASDGKFELINDFNASASIGVSAAAITLNTWTRVELHIKVGTGSAGQIEMKINGVTEASNVATTTGSTNIDCSMTGTATGGQSLTANFFIDDWAINDASGSFNNSWCGAGGIVMVNPGSDSSPLNWTKTGASATHAALTGNLPNTTGWLTGQFLKSLSATVDFEDRMALAATPAAISSGDTINAIATGAVVAGVTVTSLVHRLRDASANTVDSSAKNTVPGQLGLYPWLIKEQTWEGSPAALTKAYLDGILVSLLDHDSTTNEVDVYTFWYTIDFTPVVVASLVERGLRGVERGVARGTY